MPDTATIAGNSADLRRMMVDCQVRPYDVTDQAVLAALLAVSREKFVGAENAAIAYSDAALTIKGGSEHRRLLAPMVQARLLQAADLTASCRALDVAGGAGYSAAVLARLAGSVVALESDAEFSRRANGLFAETGITNATAVTGALEAGVAAQGPFDVILVNGLVEAGLQTLLSCLAPGGRLLAILKAPGQTGKAMRFDAIGGKFGQRSLFDASGAVLGPFAGKPAFAF